MNNKNKPSFSIHQAVGNLAILSDFDIEHPYSFGLVGDSRFVTDDQELPSQEVIWFSEENMELILDGIKSTYLVVLEYLKDISKDESFNWKSPKTKKGIQEIMTLVGKTQDMIDQYLKEVDKVTKYDRVGQSEEYLEVTAFYQKEIQKKFSHPLEGAEEWEESWEGKRASLLDIDGSSLRSFEAVKDDLEYELFYLKNADGNPFFRRELLRNIELYCDFDQDKEIKIDDPLLKMAIFKDKNIQGLSDQIFKAISPLLEEFYQKSKTPREKKLFAGINKIIMAMMLTANPHNLIGKTKTKNCTQYFEDFQTYLNRYLSSKDYNRTVSKDTVFTEVVHAICYHYFLNRGAIRKEIIGFMHFLMRKGLDLSKKAYVQKDDTVWNRLMKGDDQMRFILKNFPNGPLFKILDAVRDRVDGFYPLMQENLPKSLYSFKLEKKERTLLKIPSPTKQLSISEAHFAPEFLAFLRGCKKGGKKLLMIQLQDKTSWKDLPRAKMLEALAEQKEFKKNFFVVSLTKDSDFYHQIESYRHIEDAKDFVEIFKEHLLSPEEYGFMFPKELDSKRFRMFLTKLVDAIWDLFYEKRSALSRKNRQDFIEIFYHFLLLKIIEVIDPDLMSLTCKDAIDTGSVFSASFYAFLSVLKNGNVDDDFMRYLLYTESLMVRERALNFSRFSRCISFLAYLDNTLTKNKSKKINALQALYNTNVLKTIGIFH